jgi:omega-amidase
MNVGIIQNSAVWEDQDASTDRIRLMLKDVLSGAQKADWLILPEMALSGFTMDTEKATLRERQLEFFRSLAGECSAYVTFGAVLDGTNRCITIDPEGRIISSYAKAHLFSYAREDQHYRPGALPDTFGLRDWRITPAVCYDLRFAYLFWNRAETTDAFVVIANWPSTRVHHWRTLLQARAIENQCYVIGVNRAGSDPHVAYPGTSLVVDPAGTVIVECGAAEGLSIVTIEKAAVQDTRTRFRFLADRFPAAPPFPSTGH